MIMVGGEGKIRKGEGLGKGKSFKNHP